MREGVFRDGHPYLSVFLESFAGVSIEINCLVDTGFDGDLALPAFLARQINPLPDGYDERVLADGSLVKVAYFDANAVVDEEDFRTQVLVMGRQALVGTNFLRDHLLQIELTEGGLVSAEEL